MLEMALIDADLHQSLTWMAYVPSSSSLTTTDIFTVRTTSQTPDSNEPSQTNTSISESSNLTISSPAARR